jgi:hypothetical protein
MAIMTGANNKNIKIIRYALINSRYDGRREPRTNLPTMSPSI